MMDTVIAEMLEAEHKARFWEAATADFVALRADPEAWAREQELRDELDGTLADGLDEDLDGEPESFSHG